GFRRRGRAGRRGLRAGLPGINARLPGRGAPALRGGDGRLLRGPVPGRAVKQGPRWGDVALGAHAAGVDLHRPAGERNGVSEKRLPARGAGNGGAMGGALRAAWRCLGGGFPPDRILPTRGPRDPDGRLLRERSVCAVLHLIVAPGRPLALLPRAVWAIWHGGRAFRASGPAGRRGRGLLRRGGLLVAVDKRVRRRPQPGLGNGLFRPLRVAVEWGRPPHRAGHGVLVPRAPVAGDSGGPGETFAAPPPCLAFGPVRDHSAELRAWGLFRDGREPGHGRYRHGLRPGPAVRRRGVARLGFAQGRRCRAPGGVGWSGRRRPGSRRRQRGDEARGPDRGRGAFRYFRRREGQGKRAPRGHPAPRTTDGGGGRSGDLALCERGRPDALGVGEQGAPGGTGGARQVVVFLVGRPRV
ncbi:MAG: hypothetical protein AVDCRST_MAG02-2018, partial [uncultured Rubrobacteraceae bacterium]